jgi:hypothetical protein
VFPDEDCSQDDEVQGHNPESGAEGQSEPGMRPASARQRHVPVTAFHFIFSFGQLPERDRQGGASWGTRPKKTISPERMLLIFWALAFVRSLMGVIASQTNAVR